MFSGGRKWEHGPEMSQDAASLCFGGNKRLVLKHRAISQLILKS